MCMSVCVCDPRGPLLAPDEPIVSVLVVGCIAKMLIRRNSHKIRKHFAAAVAVAARPAEGEWRERGDGFHFAAVVSARNDASIGF